ncbi:MAG: glutamine--fructose-6-phosphate transaminase (isomerizing) [Dehalococcoidia bacterium]
MCGIVGYVGPKDAAPILIQGLRDLEYRGYDSAGIAVMPNSGAGIAIRKREGKIANLEEAVRRGEAMLGGTGIGHTRWATHGRPSDTNAHPHHGCGGDVVVIHNGIVENYAELKSELRAAGHAFASETDTETIAHLLEERIAEGAMLAEALRATTARLRGSHAILAMNRSEPGVIAGARIGNAGGIVVGFGAGETFLASDLAAVIAHTRDVAFLRDGEFVTVTAGGVECLDQEGRTVTPERRVVPLDPVSALKGQYRHFMLKEIMEQPVALSDTIGSLVVVDPPELQMTALGPAAGRLKDVRRVVLLGMGTSLHAAMIGRRYFELFAGVPAEVDNASEFRYREPILDEHTLVVTVSQSGETVDVLEAMAIARQAGCTQVTVCNVEGAQTTRVAHGAVYTRAGLERGVASTKTLLTSIVALYCLALATGNARGHIAPSDLGQRIRDLAVLPEAVASVLAGAAQYERLAPSLARYNDFLFLGRGLAYPVAMEGALKLKEISYIHAEGYAAGEMKHGPIALIDREFPTVAIATRHALRSKMVSNIEQVQARGGEVLAIVTEGDTEIPGLVRYSVSIPDVPELLEPIVATVPVQCLSYQIALQRGCDVDQPRNLAKTVTVE